MTRRVLSFGACWIASLITAGAASFASDLEQCELVKGNAQQRFEACDRVRQGASYSQREHARALLQLARIVQWTQDGMERAIGYLDTAMVADPTFTPAIIARAEWLVLYDKGHEAITLLQPALARSPRDIDLLVMTGRAYAKVRLLDQALGSFAEALKIDPDHVNASFEAGLVYEMSGDIGRAAASYEKAGGKYDPVAVPESGHGIEHPYFRAAEAYDRLGQTAKALALMTIVVDQTEGRRPPPPGVFERRAAYHETLGLNSEAVDDLTSALRFAMPHEHANLLLKRAILYQKAGRRAEAEADFDKAMRNGDLRTVLRLQVYLRNQGYEEVEINGVAGPDLLKSIAACLAAAPCRAGFGQPI